MARASIGTEGERAKRGGVLPGAWICAPQFFAWKKRLNQAGIEQFVAVRVVETGEPPHPLAVRRPAIEIRLSGGHSVIVEPGFDAGHLRAVVAALETRA